MSRRKWAFWLVLLLCLVFAVGPQLPQKVEIDKLRESVVMGVDKTEDGVNLTVLLRVTSPGDDESLRVELRQAGGRTIEEAVRELNRLSNKGLYFSHMQHVVFGRATAEEDIRPYMGFFFEHYEIRMQTDLILCEGRAADFLEKLSKNKDEDPVDSLKELLQNRSTMNESHRFTLLDYLQCEKSGLRDIAMPYMALTPGDGDKSIAKLLGYAVFDDGCLSFCLQDREARLLTLLKGELKEGLFVMETEDERLSLIVERVNRKLRVGRQGGKEADLQLVLFCRLFDGKLGTRQTAEYVEKAFTLEGRALLTHLKNRDADVMGFRRQYFAQNPFSLPGSVPAFDQMEVDLDIRVILSEDQ